MNVSQPSQVLTHPFGSSVSPTERHPSPQHNINFGSNNPFRNRALSPATASPTYSSRPERPLSTNPFFDNTDVSSFQPPPQTQSPAMSPSALKPDVTDHARELFENLSVNPSPQLNGRRQAAPPAPDHAYQRFPSVSNAAPRREKSGHRDGELVDIFADPPKRTNGERSRERRRPRRRNSESSIMERSTTLVDTDDDDRRRRERRQRERDARRKDGRHHHSSKRPQYQLDIIDKLDVTSIYGTGMFHHDGPFDACNPQRNRRGLRTAPMQAFPKNSANMALGGAGPVNTKFNLDLFNGTATEAHADYAATGISEPRKNEVAPFDPKNRVDPVHGEESMGLGTSTFLDGAPASRAAMGRRRSENENNSGLQRTKSIAQRFRGINKNSGGRIISPESSSKAAPPPSRNGPVRTNSDRGRFYQDYDDSWERKGAHIRQAEELRPAYGMGRSRSASGPRQVGGPERKFSNDRSLTVVDDGKTNNGGGGFLNRMKSLRKPRQDRGMSED